MVSAEGIDLQEEKIPSIQDWPVPKCVHSQPILARNECWRNYAAFITGPACVRTLVPAVGNVKDVPLAGRRQVDLMATIARSPPVHQWTLSPSTSCLAYLPKRMAISTSLSPLTISPNGLRQYPCATQRHKRASVHFTGLQRLLQPLWPASPTA